MIPAEAYLRNPPPLPPIVLVHGDEPWHQQQVRDALWRQAQERGLSERISIEAGADSDWDAIAQQTQAGSLFSAGQHFQLDLPKGSPGKDGAAFFRQWAQQPPADAVLAIFSGRLDGRQLKSAWVQAIEQAGLVIQAREVPPVQLPNWCIQQAQRHGLTLTPDAAALLAERVEGNLLAAAQALEILALRYGEGAAIDVPQVRDNVVDEAHYQLFALGDALLYGEVGQALHTLQRLRQTGTDATLIVWLLAREVRLYYQLALGRSAQALKIWRNQQARYQAAAQRLGPEKWAAALAQLADIDQMNKGIRSGDPWIALDGIVNTICGETP